MKYNISYPPIYEHYYKVSKIDYTFSFITAWIYPSLEIKAKLNRTSNCMRQWNLLANMEYIFKN